MPKTPETVSAQRWYQLINTTDPRLCEQVRKKLWPAKSDPDCEPTCATLDKVIAFLTPKAPQNPEKLSHTPKLLRTSYCQGDYMIAWNIEDGAITELALYLREWYKKPVKVEVETESETSDATTDTNETE